jgi:adenine-specific DNA-methyltransferase
MSRTIVANENFQLHMGDCRSALKKLPDQSVSLTVTSPPYFIGKDYDESRQISDFVSLHRKVIPLVVKKTKPGGSICWQVGYHTTSNSTIPLDYLIHDIMKKIPGTKLRNRIIWRFGHGLHAQKRFSTRHEVILWYTLGDEYHFDLDAVRVPQKYPGKRHFKGDKKGEFSGNPDGKNPEDVWDIPNIKAGHIEKAPEHPCQFPVALVRRLVLALTKPGDTVLDPFMGVGSAGVASLLEDRHFAGIELDPRYFAIAQSRCQLALDKDIKVRPDVPVVSPDLRSAVAKRPDHFREIFDAPVMFDEIDEPELFES